MPGRNDPCPCGSGKKYKQCHLKSNLKSWSVVAEEVDFTHPQKAVIHNTFFMLNEDFKKSPNPGACHLLSSIMYVLLKEQSVESDLCIGEVQSPDGPYFDHSWIEINGRVFDLAIQLTDDNTRNNPVYAGYDLGNGLITKYNYRFKAEGLDTIGEWVYKTPFSEYMDGAAPLGWEVIERVGRSLGLKLRKEELREQYKDTKRVMVTP